MTLNRVVPRPPPDLISKLVIWECPRNEAKPKRIWVYIAQAATQGERDYCTRGGSFSKSGGLHNFHPVFTYYRLCDILECGVTDRFYCEIRAERPTIIRCKPVKTAICRLILKLLSKNNRGLHTALSTTRVRNIVEIEYRAWSRKPRKESRHLTYQSEAANDGKTFWQSKSFYFEYSSSNSAGECMLCLSLSTTVR